MPRIHKKPCWDGVGASVISPTWQEQCEGDKLYIRKAYDDFVEQIAPAERSIDSVAEFFLLQLRCLSRSKLEIISDHIIFSIPEKAMFADLFLLPNCREVRVPLVFSEERFFHGLEWGPFQRARESVIDEPWWHLPRWEDGWEEKRFTKRYSHPKSRCENTGGCSAWVLDSYSLRIMLDEVLTEEQKDRDAESSTDGPSDLERVIEEMRSVLQQIEDLDFRRGHDVLDKEESYLAVVVSNLEKLKGVRSEMSQAETRSQKKAKLDD